MQHGRVVIESFESKVLENNAMGDPSTRKLAIYLPPGYDDGKRDYPSIVVLTGFTGRGTMLLNDAPWDESIADRMDRLIANDQVQPMILIMPDCLTKLGGSQYLNSSATGAYEDYLVQEIVPYVDEHYRTIKDRNFRAVAGKSSGGYGALVLAMRQPQVFGLTASHSGDTYFELSYKLSFQDYMLNIDRYGGLDGFMRDLRTIRPRNGTYQSILNTLAMASCYSPNPHAKYGFDLPFDPYTGEMNNDVWAKWLEWDPVHMVSRYTDALRSLRLLYVDAGTLDEFHLQFGARIFCKRLAEQHIPFVHEEFVDGHMNIPYRYDISFKAISDAMHRQ